ncbi:uncharacterized protein LOC127002810 [Eriocheir sinensis]|uniref:uncharacterized protein LOC127002810 n=1 Tax=Eriocheir sinensis TaxID=95602 RepID=UPI0021C69537|nr:uncharacterized protein LOC127002810 [Eriocheir sinensis]
MALPGENLVRRLVHSCHQDHPLPRGHPWCRCSSEDLRRVLCPALAASSLPLTSVAVEAAGPGSSLRGQDQQEQPAIAVRISARPCSTNLGHRKVSQELVAISCARHQRIQERKLKKDKEMFMAAQTLVDIQEYTQPCSDEVHVGKWVC